MESEPQTETNLDYDFCPECGSQENGHFCRQCGTLLSGEEQILCPRCHHVVPSGEYCNQCGQSLGGLALNLRQLAMAGDDFWVTTGPSAPAAPSADADMLLLEPDETVDLADADLPDWLEELPKQSAPPDVESRIYPALRPIPEEEHTTQRNTALFAAVILGFLLMLGLTLLILVLMMSRGG